MSDVLQWKYIEIHLHVLQVQRCGLIRIVVMVLLDTSIFNFHRVSTVKSLFCGCT